MVNFAKILGIFRNIRFSPKRTFRCPKIHKIEGPLSATSGRSRRPVRTSQQQRRCDENRVPIGGGLRPSPEVSGKHGTPAPETAPCCRTQESLVESCGWTTHNGACGLPNWGVQMKNKTLVAAVAGLGLSLVASLGTAHHSFAAQFDAEKPIELTGIVTKVQWRNPHAWFYIDVEDDDGNVANWGLELGSPNLLMRQGWTRSSIKVGDAVTVVGFHSRDGSNTGNAWVITLVATGKILSTKSSYKGDDQ